jgi:hypothetical protein
MKEQYNTLARLNNIHSLIMGIAVQSFKAHQ